MQTKRIIWSYVLIAVCGTAFFFNDASAATLVKDCGWCTSTAQASSHAQGHAYNLNSGNHTIFIVNLNNTTKAWKFEVKVAVTGPGFGEKTVTILSSQAAPASVTNSLNQMKATGLRAMSKDVTLTIELTESQLNGECDSASGGLCATVNNILQSLPDTLSWGASVSTIGALWSKLAEFIWSTAGPQLQYIVIYPDGSMEIYQYLGPGLGTGFKVKTDTAISSSGAPVGGGTLQGWASFVPSGSSGITIEAEEPGNTSRCHRFRITIASDGYVDVDNQGSGSC